MRKKILDKRDIMNTASHIIQHDGLGKCSMRQISKELGVAVGTVYNYYDSREDLLKELFNISWNATIEKLKTLVNDVDTMSAQIINISDTIDDEIKKRNGLGKELFENNSEGMKRHAKNIKNEIESIIYQVVAQKNGEIESTRILSRWVMIILFDSHVKGEGLSNTQKKMLDQIIQTEFLV